VGAIIDTPDTEFHLEARRESFCIGAMEFDKSCKKTGKVFISHVKYDGKLDNGREASIEATWSELDGLIDGLIRLRAHATEQGVLPPRPNSLRADTLRRIAAVRDELVLDCTTNIAGKGILHRLCDDPHDPTAPIITCPSLDIAYVLQDLAAHALRGLSEPVSAEPKAAPEPARAAPSSIDDAIDTYSAAGTKAARADLRHAIDAYARGTLGTLTDKVAEALGALTGRRLAGTTKLPAFVKMLQEQGRTDVQLEQLLADVFEGLVTHLHTRGDPETMIHTCQAEDIGP
jgi:hypothetical protein